jgi:hypothetical protein
MSKESLESPQGNETPTPTSEDLVNLEVEVSRLGRCDIVHEISAHMSVLRDAMRQSKTKGWPEWLLKGWNNELRQVRELINEINLQKAKDLGL